MHKLIKYTLISLDGVFEDPAKWGALGFRDDAYLRDGLGVLSACEAIVMGRTSYEANSKIWPSRSTPWAQRLNAMPKYVFSSKLERADWNNTKIMRGDPVAEISKLKEADGGDPLIWGHGLLAETLMMHRLIDVFDLSIRPVIVGAGKGFFRAGQTASEAGFGQGFREDREAQFRAASVSRRSASASLRIGKPPTEKMSAQFGVRRL